MIYSFLTYLFVDFIFAAFFQAFSPIEMPILSYLNLRGNPLNENSVDELLKHLRGFTNLTALEVTLLNEKNLSFSVKLQLC